MTKPVGQPLTPAPMPGALPSQPPPPVKAVQPALPKDSVSLSQPVPPAQPHLAEPGMPPAYAKALANLAGARTWLGRLPGNGGREVAVIVPPGVDLKQPLTVVTYFHGWHQNLGKNLLSTRPGAPSLREAILEDARHANAVFVVPMGSPPQVTHAADQNLSWMKRDRRDPPTDLRLLQESALDLLKDKWANPGQPVAVKSWVLAGHSGGGHAMNNALQAVTPGDADAPRVDQTWYLDATYERPPLLTGLQVKAIYRPRFKPGVMDTQTEAEAIKNQPGVQLTLVGHGHNDIARRGLRHLLNPGFTL